MARILLIDDDDALRGVIAQNLAMAGHTVLQAADGRQGVNLFHATPVDLVLTDLVMPGKEGVETIIELHRERPELPIIAMSRRHAALEHVSRNRRETRSAAVAREAVHAAGSTQGDRRGAGRAIAQAAVVSGTGFIPARLG